MGAAPFTFMCPNERTARSNSWDYDRKRSNYQGPVHKVRRTGRAKPNPSNRRGSRTLPIQVEYVCSTCGKTGWTKHADILYSRYPLLDGAPIWLPMTIRPAGKIELRDAAGITDRHEVPPHTYFRDYLERWIEWRMV